MIIAVLNPKGGSGKTTLSINLATGLVIKGFKVLLVDADPQGSARDWHAINPTNPVELVAMDRPGNFSSLPSVAKHYDFVVIDGGSKLEQLMAVSIKHADIVLIPIQPSALDMWATTELVDLVETRQTITGKPITRFVLSRFVKGTRLGDEIQTALAEYTFPVFHTPVTNRQVYAQATTLGISVFNLFNQQAIAEMQLITDQLLSITQDF